MQNKFSRFGCVCGGILLLSMATGMWECTKHGEHCKHAPHLPHSKINFSLSDTTTASISASSSGIS